MGVEPEKKSKERVELIEITSNDEPSKSEKLASKVAILNEMKTKDVTVSPIVLIEELSKKYWEGAKEVTT